MPHSVWHSSRLQLVVAWFALLSVWWLVVFIVVVVCDSNLFAARVAVLGQLDAVPVPPLVNA
jgi:Ca2+/Na+ antiporter